MRDYLGPAISLALVLSYQVFLLVKLRRDPTYTIQATARLARREWVSYVMEDDSRGLLAVQTLRNSTMAATFFASTAVLLMIGVLNMASQSDRLIEVLHLGDKAAIIGSTLWTVKILLLVAILFVAFFSFALSVRLLNHVGYLIVPRRGDTPDPAAMQSAARYLLRAGGAYTVGMRAYYLVVPLVFWLFGPELLVVSTLLLVIALYRLDRAPSATA